MVYKVLFDGNRAISAEPTGLEHGVVGFVPGTETVRWYALESPDEDIAISVASQVVSVIWGENGDA